MRQVCQVTSPPAPIFSPVSPYRCRHSTRSIVYTWQPSVAGHTSRKKLQIDELNTASHSRTQTSPSPAPEHRILRAPALSICKAYTIVSNLKTYLKPNSFINSTSLYSNTKCHSMSACIEESEWAPEERDWRGRRRTHEEQTLESSLGSVRKRRKTPLHWWRHSAHRLPAITGC